jgi:hypothetical protein
MSKLDRPTMAKFQFQESAELIWMAWNLFMHKILYGEWEEEVILLAQRVNTNCQEGGTLCREISEGFSDRLFRADIAKLLEGYCRGPAVGIGGCSTCRWS